ELDGQPIAGQTAASQTIMAGEAGHQLTCKVTASNSGGSGSSNSSPVTPTAGGGGAGAHASLRDVVGRATSGAPLLFAAAGAGPGARYYYQSPNGATATCGGSQPILSPIFNHRISGTVRLTVVTPAGPASTVTTPFP